MARLPLTLLVLCSLLLAGAGVARAEPRSYALVIGSNRGGEGQPSLKYATRDAQRFAALLVELGRTKRPDVEVLLEPTPERVAAALDALRGRLNVHAERGESAKLIFYYSGHARARSLSLGERELSLDSLRRALLGLPSTLTIAILDACQSGAFSGVKGAAAAADFSSSSVYDLKNAGVAVMASSTAVELSQESPELEASYFTHHLITGLRGAADRDADGTVSLDEAYGYAYQTTLSDTVKTRVGSQHATLETELRGHGSVALTYTVDADAVLQLPAQLSGRVIVMQKRGGAVVAELTKAPGNVLNLALPHAPYELVVRDGDRAQLCDLQLAPHATHVLDPRSCRALALSLLEAKLGAHGPRFERWFVEAGAVLHFNASGDDYADTLEKFGFEAADDQLFWPQLTVGVGVLRNLSLIARGEVLEKRSYERVEQGPSGEGDRHAFSWTTGSAVLGARARLPLLREYLVPFVEFAVGLAIARSRYRSDDRDDRQDHFGPAVRASAGLTCHMFWRLGCFMELGYDFAPALENDIGDRHNSGGVFISTGLRVRGLTGGR
jgi:Caspase domain